MLILYRKVGQAIQIGNDIEVRILRLKKGNISVGIQAPHQIKILRDELVKFEKNTIHRLNQPVFSTHGE